MKQLAKRNAFRHGRTVLRNPLFAGKGNPPSSRRLVVRWCPQRDYDGRLFSDALFGSAVLSKSN